MSAAARDRALLRAGLPQRYGTQMGTLEGLPVLDPVTIDTTAVTAEGRRARFAPRLAEIRALMARFDSLQLRRR